MKKDFLSIADLSRTDIAQILSLSVQMKFEKAQYGYNRHSMADRTMVMIFEKPSLRTRLSFEVAMNQLGGHAVYLTGEEIGIGSRESVADVAKVISVMGDLVMARTYKHETIAGLARYASVPVINGLSEWEHPCQILADLLTIQEVKGKFDGLKLAYLGDGENNVAHSLALASCLLGIRFSIAAPRGYWMDRKIGKTINKKDSPFENLIYETSEPEEAVKDADIVYTDTWISMGDESETGKRLREFKPYRITEKLMKEAKPDAIFMHDLPAYRDLEVAGEVIDSPQSVVFQQAENRLHAQKGLVVYIMKGFGS